jgi:hypothetical protein
VARNFQLARERIVDAFLAGLPDLPAPDDPDLTATMRPSMPVFGHCRLPNPGAERRCLSPGRGGPGS